MRFWPAIFNPIAFGHICLQAYKKGSIWQLIPHLYGDAPEHAINVGLHFLTRTVLMYLLKEVGSKNSVCAILK